MRKRFFHQPRVEVGAGRRLLRLGLGCGDALPARDARVRARRSAVERPWLAVSISLG
jgi:hypothetical protein